MSKFANNCNPTCSHPNHPNSYLVHPFHFFVFFFLIKLKSRGLLIAIIKIMTCHNVVSLREIERGFKWSSCTCSQCSLIKVKANKDSSEYSYLHYNSWWTTLVIKLARFGLSWGWCTFYQKQKCVQIKYFSSLETAIEHQPASYPWALYSTQNLFCT